MGTHRTGSTPYKNRLHFVQTPLFHHDHRFYAFLIWIPKVGSNVALFPCLLLVERCFREMFSKVPMRNFYCNTAENMQNLSHSLLIVKAFIYGSGCFEELGFDEGSRLVYLVIAFAKGCCHRPFSSHQGLCPSFLVDLTLVCLALVVP